MPRLATAAGVLAASIAGAAPSTAAGQPAYQHLRMIAPAAPGGGWDQTARAMQQVLQRAGLVHTASVENIPGAAGTIGLARFIGAERGRGDVVMVSGLIMVSAIVTNGSPVTLREVTPLATADGRVRSDRGSRGLAAAFAAGPHPHVQGTARVHLVGRRVGGRQRSDPGRARRKRGRRAATARQLHRLLGRRRSDVRRARRSGVGGHQRPRGIPAPDRSGHRARARAVERRAPAEPRRADASRAGRRRRVRELALARRTAGHQRRRPGAPRAHHRSHGALGGVARGARPLSLERSLSRRQGVRFDSWRPRTRGSGRF